MKHDYPTASFLEALVGGDWMADAACKGAPVGAFFPEKGHHPDKSYCLACPVQQECLDYAMETEVGGRFGLWGGTTYKQRAKLSGNSPAHIARGAA